MNARKFNLMDFVEQLSQKAQSVIGKMTIYTFYENVIKLNRPELNEKLLNKSTIQLIFDSEQKFEGQGRTLRLFCKNNVEQLNQLFIANPRIVRFLCKNYGKKDIVAVVKSLENQEVADIFDKYGYKEDADEDDDEVIDRSKKNRRYSDDDDDEDEDDEPKQAKRKKAKDTDGSDDQDDDSEETPRRRKHKKGKKVIENDDNE